MVAQRRCIHPYTFETLAFFMEDLPNRTSGPSNAHRVWTIDCRGLGAVASTLDRIRTRPHGSPSPRDLLQSELETRLWAFADPR
jgi:hypothetical protein